MLSKRYLIPIIALALLAASGPEVFGGERSRRHARELDRYMTRLNEIERLNGAVLVVEDGGVIYKKAFGFADFEWKTLNTTDTSFRVGSITKTFTAVLTMQLVEEGKIDLDGVINDYLPDYPPKQGGKVKIRHLVTHMSGIPNYVRDIPEMRGENAPWWTTTYEPGEFIDCFSTQELRFEPGTKFEYCNSGFYLLGVIIEKVTGKTYAELLDERILTPLEMSGTGYWDMRMIVPKRAKGHYQSLEGYQNGRYVSQTVMFSAGGMCSTVEDLYRYDRALYTDILLSEESRALMFSQHHRNKKTGRGYGLGWFVGALDVPGLDRKLPYVGHAGDGPGFFGYMMRFVEDDDMVVFLTNTNGLNMNNSADIVASVVSILNDIPIATPKQSIMRVLYKTIDEDGIEAAVSQYHDLKKHHAGLYLFDESELNRLGYSFLGDGRFDVAIEIFKLNVEAYPESANAYDSLGEAYMKNGEKSLAIDNYRKSLELDPDSENAVKMLERLEAGD